MAGRRLTMTTETFSSHILQAGNSGIVSCRMIQQHAPVSHVIVNDGRSVSVAPDYIRISVYGASVDSNVKRFAIEINDGGLSHTITNFSA